MALLKLENIGKIYDSNDILTIGIRGVNLAFDYNEFVIIEGESGSGKSTLLNVIGANDSYEEGELYFNGSETSHYSESEWEKYRDRNIATIFQDFNIIENLTVLENVELALLRFDDRKERRRIAKELIEKVGLTKQANQKGSRRSGGEKQRTVIARALAKDSPVILADEPTGNLDVKSSKEVAKLLKDVSKDKLVIVVTHNPEYFKQYATRRVRIFDGHVSEDTVVAPPAPKESADAEMAPITRKHAFSNMMYIGTLNYRSRPKFTGMMTLALFVCAITLFIILEVFGQSLIQPYTASLDDVGIAGKVIVSSSENQIGESDLDDLALYSGARYALLDRDLSEFEVPVAKTAGGESERTVICLYDPYSYLPDAGSAVLVLPKSLSYEEQRIKNTFYGAGVGITDIRTVTTVSNNGIRLYLNEADLRENGKRIRAINSGMQLGEVERTVYTFEKNEELESGTVNFINSNFYEATKYTALFRMKADRSYTVGSVSEKRADVGGLVVQFSPQDYDEVFSPAGSVNQACLYFKNDQLASAAVEKLPDGYMGMLSDGRVYLRRAGEIFTMNVVYYFLLICIGVLFAALISVIFGRSVNIFKTDFAVYRTLGIARNISSRSLYVQMCLIFLPTLVLLPLVSFFVTTVRNSAVPLIGVGDYLFIELLMFCMVELVALRFNRVINGQSIRKTLKRGSK